MSPPERTTREGSSSPAGTLKLKMTVPPGALEETVSHYLNAKKFVLQWLYEHKTIKLSEVHHGVYGILREKFQLPSKLAVDCYRDAIAVYKGWLKNPKRGRFPRIKNISVWLSPKASYTLDLENKKAKILGQEVEIVGYPHNINFYKDWEVKEARLLKRGDDWYLHVVVKKNTEQDEQVKDAIAVDINMDFLTLGNNKQIVVIPTRLTDAYHYKKLAENLQRKYPKRWKENKRILNRIRSFHLKARNILTDFARKVSKWVIDEAKRLDANVIILEKLNKMINHVKNLKKDYRDRLYLMQYSRLQYWIEWQAKKHGMKVIYVNASGTSTKCPFDGTKMEEVDYRTFKCPRCGYEDHRDYIAVLNLYARGSLTLLSASPMRDVIPNRGEEPSPFR